MSPRDGILAEVAKRGRSEVSLISLTSAYFRGEDGIERLQEWARDNGVRVSFNPALIHPCRDSERRVLFYK